MVIVVDTTVVIAVIANEATKPRLIELTKDAELVAPASLAWEIGNAFSAMFKQKRITREQAVAAVLEYQRIPIRMLDVPLPNAVELSSQLGIYAYDAYMIYCAQQTGAPLLTLDNGLIVAAGRVGVTTLKVQP
jgi:predicted nucleic acid-binding protein